MERRTPARGVVNRGPPPSGAQIKPPDQVLVQELDLSYAILPWSPKLKKGETMSTKYGRHSGFRYYQDEDRGIFWSNDPHVTIGQMIPSLDLAEADPEHLRDGTRNHYATRCFRPFPSADPPLSRVYLLNVNRIAQERARNCVLFPLFRLAVGCCTTTRSSGYHED